MLDTRRNGWYIGLDHKNLVVSERSVDEAMEDHAEYIMDSCEIWRKAGAGNTKSQGRGYRVQEAEARWTSPEY